jgi:hypothetical protein
MKWEAYACANTQPYGRCRMKRSNVSSLSCSAIPHPRFVAEKQDCENLIIAARADGYLFDRLVHAGGSLDAFVMRSRVCLPRPI